MTGDNNLTLVLMRHAKSSWTVDTGDHDRPLSARGRRDGRAAGRLLAQRGIQPDLVLCSTARRATETFDRVVSGGACYGRVVQDAELYEADTGRIVALARRTDEAVRTLLVIGHGPALVDTVTRLAAPGPLVSGVAARFPTSAVAMLTFPGPWDALAEGAAALVAYDIPRARTGAQAPAIARSASA